MRRLALLIRVLLLFLIASPVAVASAPPAGYKENPALARELVAESIATGKQWAILQADCRTAKVGAAQVALTGDATECLIVARNGRGKPIFCGVLHVALSEVSPAVLADVDYADQAKCKDVKKFLKSLPRRYVATAASAGAPIA